MRIRLLAALVVASLPSCFGSDDDSTDSGAVDLEEVFVTMTRRSR